MTGAATRYIGAIDQGTTSTRFIVFDRAGETIATAQTEHRQIYPHPGWVEHDPIEIWRNTQAVIAEALRSSGLTHGDLAAVGITNQRETTLVWDRTTGEPIHNALVWQDTRVDPLVAEYARDGGQDRFRAKTGLPLASYFSGLKLRWLLDNVPNARRRAEEGDLLFGTIDTWLLWNFTGLHVTDVHQRQPHATDGPADAGLGRWAARGIRYSACRAARIVPSSTVYGVATGELDGVPIAGILGDQQAALVGQTCSAPGRGEEHLRHRLLPADEHRLDADAVDQRAGDHGRLQVRQPACLLCA